MTITAYPTSFTRGLAGQIADQTFRRVASARNKEATAIPFGLAVKKGVNPGEALLPSAGTDKVNGIVVHQHAQNNIGLTATTDVLADDNFDMLTRGVIWVKVEEAVTENDPVYVRFANGAGGTQKGAFRKSADTTTALLVKGARFLTAAAAGGLAQVEFDALVAQTT